MGEAQQRRLIERGFCFFASCLEVFLVTFPGLAKNVAPHKLIVNTNQIESRAPVKASQKAFKNEEKNGMKTKTNE